MKPIYVNKEHEIIIEKYLDTVCSFAEQCSSKNKFNNYLDVLEQIIEYHNEYKIAAHTGNWSDFLLIIPINAQLQVGDVSPNFTGPICMNGEEINPDIVTGDYWSLYEEGYGKVTWINLFTSW